MNPLQQIIGLLPPAPALLVGQVTAHNGDGTSTVDLPGGRTLRARGQSVAIGLQAFVRGGLIEGEAPSLPFVTIDV